MDWNDPYAVASAVTGWGYVIIWLVSMYPQPIANWRRQSVRGFSLDYIVLFTVGFVALTVYTVVFYFDSGVQAEYSRRNNGLENLIATTDLFNALHSLLIALLTLAQCFIYDRDPLVLHLWVKLFLAGCGLATVGLVGFISVQHWEGIGLTFGGDMPTDPLPLPMPPLKPPPLPSPPVSSLYPDWIDLLYLFSTIKIVITCIQNVPQLYLNFVRKSTVGWAVDQVWLDLIGAVLSLAQLFIDAAATGHKDGWLWVGIVGNPAKLGMGLLSMGFDFLFLWQHYVLYADRTELAKRVLIGHHEKVGSMTEEPVEDETEPFLPPRTLVIAPTLTSEPNSPFEDRANRTLPRAIYTGASDIPGPLGARIAFSPPGSAANLQTGTPTTYGASLLPTDTLLRRKSTIVLAAESLVGSAGDFKGVSWREVLRRPSRMGSLIAPDQGESGRSPQGSGSAGSSEQGSL